MILGIGVDMVDIERFEGQITRSPALMRRLFTDHERELPLRSLAARYAAKEALIKALGGSDGVRWQEIEVPRLGERTAPAYVLSGDTAGTLAARGVARTHLSLSHDGGLALAYAVLEGAPAGDERDRAEAAE
ncbi:holo-ACP synthase [Microbacterium sp. gxy059]|uniref:holo-ACP synthase n=1 Tax=Microbacterium sp. gxy059 TaxID=2957199 RepID=UPI003D95AA3F